MLLGYVHSIYVDAILEPALVFGDLDIIPTHLPLTHNTILAKGPVFQTITALPLHTIMGILVFVPKLDRDFVVTEGEKLFA